MNMRTVYLAYSSANKVLLLISYLSSLLQALQATSLGAICYLQKLLLGITCRYSSLGVFLAQF